MLSSRALPLGLLALTLSMVPGCAQGGAGIDTFDSGFAPRDGGRSDARLPLDAVMPLDVGMVPDAGIEVDAFMPLDDAGRDGGPVDGGGHDANVGERCRGVDCSSRDTACMVGQCQPATGLCTAVPRDNGTSCDDGNPCTTGDMCMAGSCTAGAARDCSGMNSACAMGTCNRTTGACVATPVGNGTSCDTNPSDCVSEICDSGSCLPRPASECSPCGPGGTNVCSGGTCGPAPSTVSYDFETGLPDGWSVGGTSGWVIDTSRAHGGTRSARSGAIGDRGTSSMSATFTVSRPVRVFFWYATSTEVNYDWLEIFVDGVRQARWSGTHDWTQGAAFMGAGTHTLEFRYTRDASGGAGGAGTDQVWIDDVSVVAAPPAIEFEDAALPAGFTTSGSVGWSVDTTRPRSGTRSARSGAIGNWQTSSLWRTITLSHPATMSYWYSVSSQQHGDFLELWINGVRRERHAGEVAWSFTSYPLPAGTHQVEWRYVKDSTVANGTDRAWIDDVITGEEPPSGEPICGS